MRLILIIFTIICVLLTGCSSGRKALSAQAYVSWYKSAGYPYRDTVVQENVFFILEGIPVGLDLSRQLQAGKINAEELKTLYEENKTAGLSYQLTVILPESGVDIYSFRPKNTPVDFDRQHYFAFGMKEDLLAIGEKGDSLECGFFLQERLMGNYPRARFTFDFGNELPKEIVFKDRIFSGQPVIFKFNGHGPIPGLKTKSLK